MRTHALRPQRPQAGEAARLIPGPRDALSPSGLISTFIRRRLFLWLPQPSSVPLNSETRTTFLGFCATGGSPTREAHLSDGAQGFYWGLGSQAGLTNHGPRDSIPGSPGSDWARGGHSPCSPFHGPSSRAAHPVCGRAVSRNSAGPLAPPTVAETFP